MKPSFTPHEKFGHDNEHFSRKIYNPLMSLRSNRDTEPISIEICDKYTRIDFIYQAKDYYENGGWVRIEPDTFIRPVGSNLCLYLKEAINITLSPRKLYFRTPYDILAYTLYFPSIPKETTAIDIIEVEDGNPEEWFNFYNVSINHFSSKKLVMNLEN